MRFLLNAVYLLALVLYAPWLIVGMVRHGKYREGFAAKLWGQVPRRAGPETCIWLHAVSVGEVNLLGPMITRLEKQHPLWTCVISTTTMTGYRLARQKYAPRPVFYCPLDFSWAVRRAMRRMRPDLLVLTELELWPNLIFTANRLGVPVAVINGRMSDRSLRGYRRIRWFMTSLLRRIDLIAVQSDAYRDRFLGLGAPPERVHVTGSIKFDGARIDRTNALTRHLLRLANIADDDVVLLAGSTQYPEELVALETFQALAAEFPRLRLILVPRHPERFDSVAAELEKFGMDWQRRSQLGRMPPHEPTARILLVDGMGELDAWWGTARIAFVGGSLTDRGGQNMIEPAAYGAAVSFGPHTHNFHDVVSMMIQAQAAHVVHNGQQLTDFVRQCLEDPAYAPELGRRAQQLVLQHRGAADQTCVLLSQLLDGPQATTQGK
ncbi:MAG: 3-deoxy-D-manno-octulosonic acid transferase [Planctomycetaceae bacterium]|nr:MAG: 3-deoxy-D-manno-octulosonic acid transferase [Planctomycetaceae bacterium]